MRCRSGFRQVCHFSAVPSQCGSITACLQLPLGLRPVLAPQSQLLRLAAVDGFVRGSACSGGLRSLLSSVFRDRLQAVIVWRVTLWSVGGRL